MTSVAQQGVVVQVMGPWGRKILLVLFRPIDAHDICCPRRDRRCDSMHVHGRGGRVHAVRLCGSKFASVCVCVGSPTACWVIRLCCQTSRASVSGAHPSLNVQGAHRFGGLSLGFLVAVHAHVTGPLLLEHGSQ